MKMKDLREKMKSFCKNSEIGNTNNININIGNKHYILTENMPIKQNLVFILSVYN